MVEIVTIAPLVHEPGLVAYELPQLRLCDERDSAATQSKA
jgi:hypothetical protein